MRSWLTRVVAGLSVAALLGVGLVVLDLEPSPASAFCTSSLDPKCQPGNIPILVEAGIVTDGTGTLATGGTAAVTAGSSAALFGVQAWEWGVLAGLLSAAVMTAFGFPSGVEIKTNPAWAGSGNTACPTPYNPAAGGATNFTTSEIAAFPPAMCTAFQSYNQGFAGPGYIIGHNFVNTGTFLKPNPFTVPGQGAKPTQNYNYGGRCYYYSAGVASSASLGSPVSVTGATWSSTTPGCALTASGRPLVAIVVDTGYSGSNTSSPTQRVVWTSNFDPGFDNYAGTIRVTVVCKSTAGTHSVVVTAPTTGGPGTKLAVPPASCAPGEVAISSLVEFKPTSSSTWFPLGTATAPPSVVNLPATYPNCFNGSITCELTLWKINPADSSLEWCGSVGQLCPNWGAAPAGYECHYGATVIDVDWCSAYRDTGPGGVGVLPNTNDTTSTTPAPLPPDEPVPNPLPNPVVGLDGNPGTLPDGILGPESDNCFPTGWGVVNPVSWVLLPVQCAIRWAFVPRADVIEAKFEAISAEAAGGWLAAPMAVITALTAAVDIAGTGCQGPPLHLDIDFGPLGALDWTGYPMDACSEPMAGVASAVNGMLGFSIVAWTGLTLVRYLMTLIGYVPFGGGAGGGGPRFRDLGGDD